MSQIRVATSLSIVKLTIDYMHPGGGLGIFLYQFKDFELEVDNDGWNSNEPPMSPMCAPLFF